MPQTGSSDAPSAELVYDAARSREMSALRRKARVRGSLMWASLALLVLTLGVMIPQMHAPRQETMLAASVDGKALYILPDGSSVTLNKGSRLSYVDGLKGADRRVTLHGEAYFDVTRDETRPFIVEASGLEVTVHGTRFTVSAAKGRPLATYLEEGSIEASYNGGAAMMLEPGQAAVLQGEELCRQQVNAANHTCWAEGNLSFDNTCLSDILESMEHWFDVRMQCNDRDFAAAERLSLTIRSESLTEILDDIADICKMKYYYDPDSKSVVFVK